MLSKILTKYGLSSHEQPPPVNDHSGLMFSEWLLTGGSTVVLNLTSQFRK